MARIAGIDIPREKKIPYSLCYIHGIGLKTAIQICNKAKKSHRYFQSEYLLGIVF